MIQVDTKRFLRAWQKLRHEQIPKAVVFGISRTARTARDEVRALTRQRFRLHTDFIPNSVRHIPDRRKSNQMTAAVRAFRNKHKSFRSAVFARGANAPKSKLDFMVPHEEGGTKTSVHGGKIAVPAHDIKKYRYKTRTGKIKKAWKPENLLKHYNEVGPNTKGTKLPPRNRRGKPKSFLLNTKSGKTFVVRRKARGSKKLEFLYHLIKSAQIRERWDFTETVHTVVRRDIFDDVNRLVKRIRAR